MALTNRRDPDHTAQQLTSWLPRVLPGATDVTVSEVRIPSSSGMSNDTVLFDATWQTKGEPHSEQLVARIEPAGAGSTPPTTSRGSSAY